MKKRFTLGLALIIAFSVFMPLDFDVVKAAPANKDLKAYVSTASATTVTIKWNKQKGVKKYTIYRSLKKDKGYKKIATTKNRIYKNKKLKENKTYYYKIKGKGYSNIVRKVRVRGNYKKGTVYGPYITAKQRAQVKNAVAKFVNTKIKPGMTSYEKVRVAHDYIVKKCKYAKRWDRNAANSAWGSLVYGEAQCSGYARGFKALCDGMGVKCYYVHANNKAENPEHQWNIVKVGKRYYHIDVQANDSAGFDYIYLISDYMEKNFIGMEWDRKKFPKCPYTYATGEKNSMMI